MDSTDTKLIQQTKRAITAAASLAASAMLARSLINDYLPYEVHDFLSSITESFRSRLSTQHTIIIKETEGYATNQIFHAAETYIATRISPSLRRLRVSKVDNEQTAITLSLEQGEEMVDVFEGVHIKWLFLSQDIGRNSQDDDDTEKRSFELSFHHKHKEMVLGSYLPHILERAEAIEAKERTLGLHMNNGDYWTNMIKLHHPATFDTLAMEPKVKQDLMDDLARFVERKEYYKRIGKAWKRGYLLYGPPGTGKSSLVAAIANYLKFDIYNLELGEVGCNKSLQRLLLGMANKSILVVEDIDCSIDLNNREADTEPQIGPPREEKVTLSGLLNSVDGLWSCCGEERIIVFTTNYKDRLDSALLRPGRMDMHIHMGYCEASAFRILASNYHGIDDHPLFGEIGELIKEVQVTPAEVAEQMMRSDDSEIALKGFIEFLRGKKILGEKSN